MRLKTEAYCNQVSCWPVSDRHILAQFDDETIIVYQAYSPTIGDYAIQHGHFGGEFKYSRMSWIKPNFLWMMYRSNWGQSQGQEIVLGIRLRRTFFDSLLEQAVPSTFSAEQFTNRETWQTAVAQSDVRLQWDPDHDPHGNQCERKAIQLGLRGEVLEAYGKREILEIIDMSPFVAQQRQFIHEWQSGRLLTPVEHVYVPKNEAESANIRLDEWNDVQESPR